MAEHENNLNTEIEMFGGAQHTIFYLSIRLAILLSIYYPTSLCLSAPFQFKHKPLKISSIQPLSTWKTGKITICVIFRSVAVLHLGVCLSVKYGSLIWACQNHLIDCKPRHDDFCCNSGGFRLFLPFYNTTYLNDKIVIFT